jgi:dTDP-4-amino-4,6-dideoxygalactose transaminase
MVITGDAATDATLRMLRNHGSSVRYYHDLLGYNSRLDEIQAAVVRVKLKRIDAFNEGRRRAAALYRKHIRRNDVTLPSEAEGCHHVYHQFTVLTDRRDQLQEALSRSGIASAVYYPVPLHRQEVFRDSPSRHGAFPVSDRLAARVLSLPMFPEITEDEILTISGVINGSA